MTTNRQANIDVIMQAGFPSDYRANRLRTLTDGQIAQLASDIKEHTHDGQHWLQVHGQSLLPLAVTVGGCTLFYLKCSQCGNEAIFTAEGVNDEYPEPLCESCESGENGSDEQ